MVKEIIYVFFIDYLYVCFVNIGFGIFFILGLELRYIDDFIYKRELGLFDFFYRYYIYIILLDIIRLV